MAKDDKKRKLKSEPKSDVKDKDIHLNLVGVPKKNVNVKKTYPRQNNEEYQLFRISIDTKGKQKERKHRVGSLEPSPKKAADRKRYRSEDYDDLNSDDSYTDLSLARKAKSPGRHREKQSTAKPKRKSVDSEMCITIPGEKGKAIRIVGSSTKQHEDTSSKESSQRSKRKRAESPRQVGFAGLDEVYGTTPEESSLESRSSLPYRQNSPQVYNIKNNSPTSVFKDPMNINYVPGRRVARGDEEKLENALSPNYASYPNSRLEERSKPSLHGSQIGSPTSTKQYQNPLANNREQRGDVRHSGLVMHDLETPSTSKGHNEEIPESSPSKQSGHSKLRSVSKSTDGVSSNVPSSFRVSSNFEPTSENSTESKGKYPFYPYDKQKRGKSPSKLFQESIKQEDRDSFSYQKLPSIPEARSTEQYPTQESTVLTKLVTKSNEVNKNPSSPGSPNANKNTLSSNEQYPYADVGVRIPSKTSPVQTRPITGSKEVNEAPSLPVSIIAKEKTTPSTEQHLSGVSGARIPPKESSVLTRQITGSKEVNETPLSPGSLIAKEKTTPSKGQHLSGVLVARIPPKKSSVLTRPMSGSKEVNEPLSSLGLLNTKRNTLPSAVPYSYAAVGVRLPPKKFAVLERRISRSNELNENPSSLGSLNAKKNTLPFTQPPAKPFNKPDQKDTSRIKPIFNDALNSSQMQKPIPSTTSNTRRYNLEDKHISYVSQISNPPQRSSIQVRPSTAQMTPKLQKKIEYPVVNYNVQSSPSQLETPNTNRQELKNAPSIRSRPSSLKNNMATKPQNLRDSMFDNDQAAVKNRTPITVKQPETADKQIMTDKILKPKERILLEINEELKKKNSPLAPKPLQSPEKLNVSSNEKDSKRKSKLSQFVSSIPKPMFRRNKSLENKSTDKGNVSDKTPPKLSSLGQTPNVTKEQMGIKDDARKPVEESAIVKQSHEPFIEAYPSWVTSPPLQNPEKRQDAVQSPSLKDNPLIDKNLSNDFAPYKMDESSSVEIANRSYDEHSLPRKASTAPIVQEHIERSIEGGDEEDATGYLDGQILMGLSTELRKPQVPENNRKELEDSRSNESMQDDLDRMNIPENIPDYNNYNKSKMPFEGADVTAYPGKTYEQTPFGYEPQAMADSKEENEAMTSLKDALEGNKSPKTNEPYPSSHLVDRNPSLVSRASKIPDEELKNTNYGHPIQVLRGSTGSRPISEKSTSKQISFEPSQETGSIDRVVVTGKMADSKRTMSKKPTDRLNYTPARRDGEDVQKQFSNENPLRKQSEEKVYMGNVPDSTYSVFRSEGSKDELSPYKEENQIPITKQKVPKGILIFVNKKNETSSPFEKGSPSRKGEEQSKKSNYPSGTKKRNKRATSSSADTTASSTAPSSNYASGDKKSVFERSPSGGKTTQKYSCGCIRIITTDPRKLLKKEELITAFCKDGSKCDVSRARGTPPGRSNESSTVSWEDSRPSRRPGSSGRYGDSFPDIEVIADGVVSRKPIKPRTPAPTKNGAKLTGSFKIKSNKLNGVCNLYLDRKLKQYLRNNMDKIQQLVEDDD